MANPKAQERLAAMGSQIEHTCHKVRIRDKDTCQPPPNVRTPYPQQDPFNPPRTRRVKTRAERRGYDNHPPQPIIHVIPPAVSLNHPPPYEGKPDEDWNLFETNFRTLLLLSKTPEAEKVPMLMMKLAGQAQKTLIAMPLAKKADLESALQNMKLRYVNPNRSWQSSAEFDNREWRRGEKIEDFLLDLQRLANLAFDSEEEERIKIRDQFVRGIPTWLKKKGSTPKEGLGGTAMRKGGSRNLA